MIKSKEQVVAFLTELAELSRRHGIEIGGCGCCGSPFLREIDEAERGGGYEAEGKDDLSHPERFSCDNLAWVGPEGSAERTSDTDKANLLRVIP